MESDTENKLEKIIQEYYRSTFIINSLYHWPFKMCSSCALKYFERFKFLAKDQALKCISKLYSLCIHDPEKLCF